jgi:deoxycytidylate deaminase
MLSDESRRYQTRLYVEDLLEVPYLPAGRHLEITDELVDALPMGSAEIFARCSGCVKLQTGASIWRQGQLLGWGNNSVARPQEICPRQDMLTGTGYDLCKTVCQQHYHAERATIECALEAGHDLAGSSLFLYGHWWVCEDCWDHIIKARIARVFLASECLPL